MIAWITISNVVLLFSAKENVQLLLMAFVLLNQKNWAVLALEQNIRGLSQFTWCSIAGQRRSVPCEHGQAPGLGLGCVCFDVVWPGNVAWVSWSAKLILPYTLSISQLAFIHFSAFSRFIEEKIESRRVSLAGELACAPVTLTWFTDSRWLVH